MVRIVTFALLAAALYAQNGGKPADKPPAKVDRALRARVNEFYQDFVTGRFRDAEALVAKDTKDYFFSANKVKYLSLEIQSIVYSDKFRRAQVDGVCERDVMFGPEVRRMKLPMSTTWKLEGGKWYWYVDQTQPRDTPFGKMGGTAASGATPAASGPAGPPGMPGNFPITPDFVLHKVSADKDSLALKAGESAEVTFVNAAPGMMSVALEGKPQGLEVTPERADLKPGGKAALTVKAIEGARTLVLNFRVGPTGEIIPVKVNIN